MSLGETIHASPLHFLWQRCLQTFCLDRALRGGLVVAGRGRAVHQETTDLDLADGIEGHKTDVGIGEGLGAGLDLTDDLGTILAAEHGELPHSPVAVVVVASSNRAKADSVGVGGVSLVSVRELQARSEAVADDVVDLLGNLVVGQRGQVGESLEELVVVRSPDLEGSCLLDRAVAHEDSLLGGGGLECSSLRCHGGLDERRSDSSHFITCEESRRFL